MSAPSIEAKITSLKVFADIDCNCDEEHDCDNCPYCIARNNLNELNEIIDGMLQIVRTTTPPDLIY